MAHVLIEDDDRNLMVTVKVEDEEVVPCRWQNLLHPLARYGVPVRSKRSFVGHMPVEPPCTHSTTWFVLMSTTLPNLRASLTESWSAPWLRVMPNSNPSAGSGSGVEGEEGEGGGHGDGGATIQFFMAASTAALAMPSTTSSASTGGWWRRALGTATAAPSTAPSMPASTATARWAP
jgi:hypothetical protein